MYLLAKMESEEIAAELDKDWLTNYDVSVKGFIKLLSITFKVVS